MDTLVERRKRGDLLMAYRVFSREDNVDPSTWFQTLEPTRGAVTRRHDGYKRVEIPVCHGEIRRNFWSVRVCEPWNSLPDSVKMAESVNCFKNSVDELKGWGGQKTRR